MNFDFDNKLYTKEEITDIVNYHKLSMSDIYKIIRNQEVDNSLFIEHPEFLIRDFEIEKYQPLTTDILTERFDEFNVDIITKYQVLSKDFVRNFKDRLNWANICVYQQDILDEDFIEEMEDYIDFKLISEYTELSEGFIMKYLNKLDLFTVLRHQKISKQLMRDIVYTFIDKNASDWVNYKNVDKFMRKYVHRSDNFNKTKDDWKIKEIPFVHGIEAYDDYFIGKKIIRKNRYSITNFRYKYEVGNTYYTWSDYSKKDPSFGFGIYGIIGDHSINKKVGTNELVIDVKVNYEDITFIGGFSNDYKIRANKITIIN